MAQLSTLGLFAMHTFFTILIFVVLSPFVLVLLFAIWLGVDRLIQVSRGYVIRISGHFRTTVIFYSEGKNRLHLISHDTKRTFHLPDSAEWIATMPEWARDKREQILDRITRDWRTTKFYRLKFDEKA